MNSANSVVSFIVLKINENTSAKGKWYCPDCHKSRKGERQENTEAKLAVWSLWTLNYMMHAAVSCSVATN